MRTLFILRTNAFYGDAERELWLPGDWQIETCRMAGEFAPALSDDEIRLALRHPIGSPPLARLARGASRVCILFDDISKPTPTSRVLPFVLEELWLAGIRPGQVSLVCAGGTHRPPTNAEYALKLGQEAVRTFPVYYHSIWENLINVGTTSLGTPVLVNREFASCDLRLGIGCVLPHDSAGFGGGGKIAVPGAAGAATIAHLHRHRTRGVGKGQIYGNEFRMDLEQAARLAGLQFKADVVFNGRREIAGLFAGDFVAEHRAAVEFARSVYATPPAAAADIVITNAYPAESQMLRCEWTVPLSLKDGGDVVIVRDSVEGENLHQFSSRFGADFGGQFWSEGARYALLGAASRVLLFAPEVSAYDRLEMLPPGTTWCRDWSEIVAVLERRNGPGTRVAVYPCAGVQMPSELTAPASRTISWA